MNIMTLVTISPTYRITIPREIRDKFNLKPGQKVYFETDGKVLTIYFEEPGTSKTSEFFENPEV
jgi:AbrB family looped-hinge helix DNA binding protein